MADNRLNPEFAAEQERLRLQGIDPRAVRTLPDRTFTEVDMGPDEVTVFRPMTDEEIERYEKSKTGRTKVKPADIDGAVPPVMG